MKTIMKYFVVMAILALMGMQSASASKMFHYKDSSGAIFKICKDKQGHVVYKPNGKKIPHGKGHTWKKVKSQYGLSKIYKKSEKKYKKCP